MPYGEIEVRGPQAADLLQFALIRDLSGQKTGQVKLSALLNDRGGIIDDLTVYKMADDFFMLVTNATTQEADFQRIQAILDQKSLIAGWKISVGKPASWICRDPALKKF